MGNVLKILIINSLLIFICGLSSCSLVFRMAANHSKKETIATWRDGIYKVRIQSRADYVGPYYYHCKVKEKKVGGLFYKTIISKTFSGFEYSNCKVRFSTGRSDSLTVDVCAKKITKTSIQ